MAAVWRLPVVFILENNQYAMSTPLNRSFALVRLSDRAAAYGFPGVTVDGNDVFAVHDATAEAVARARHGDGPTLIECVTYRWKGHSKSDANRYRTKDEIRDWMSRCPILRLERFLVSKGILPEEEILRYHEEAKREIEEALSYVETCHELDYHEMLQSVYA